MLLKSKLLQYIKDIFGWKIESEDLGRLKNSLPYALLNAAEYCLLTIEGISIIAVFPVSDKDFRWTKNLASTVSKKLNLPTVLILENIASRQRRSLIESRINFIVPEHQAYLPVIGAALNERGLGRPKLTQEKLSPMATSVILYYLRNPQIKGSTISEMAAGMDYSVKSLSLAISELARHGLITIMPEGRKKLIQFPLSKKALWEKAFPLMVNPIDKKLYTDDIQSIGKIGVKASDSALSEISMLSPPQQEIYAVYSRDPRLKDLSLDPCDGSVAVEIWKINPGLTAINGIADAFSLALSYRDDDDPRIAIELKKLLNTSFTD